MNQARITLSHLSNPPVYEGKIENCLTFLRSPAALSRAQVTQNCFQSSEALSLTANSLRGLGCPKKFLLVP